MSAENIRFYFKMDTALNIETRVIFEELYSVHGDQAPCLRIVKQWFKRLHEVQEELEDETRPGRPITETSPSHC